jgi:hypothetical protein
MTRAQIHPMPSFFDRYIQLVEPEVELIEGLQKSLQSFIEYDFSLLGRLGDKVYAPDKWTVKDILLHIIDNERIMAYRALRFARNDKTVLPGYDEQVLAKYGNANTRLIQDLKREFVSVRLSSITLFKSMNEEALMRLGKAFQVDISPLALGFVLIGHQMHHFKVIEEKYLPLLTS